MILKNIDNQLFLKKYSMLVFYLYYHYIEDNKKNWYWIIRESGDIFSSKENDVVEPGNTDYLAWKESGNTETHISESDLILLRIQWLEESATLRRLREAALGTDNGWLESLDAQIAALRDQL